ncbi:MAG: hypothetical protein EB120_02360, partial [Proteobacteria bacterium]|nr:hypothetical protein [Pseudomonadota bacterium]
MKFPTESFQTADAIAITLPFTQETKGLIDAENIHAIPQRAKFISTSFPQILTDD